MKRAFILTAMPILFVATLLHIAVKAVVSFVFFPFAALSHGVTLAIESEQRERR